MAMVVFVGWGGPLLAQEDQKEWKEYKSNHFLIYYKDAPKDFVETVEQTAEAYYREITEDLGFQRYNNWAWDQRAKIYIYRDAGDYIDSAKLAKWSHGAAQTRTKTIRTFPSAHGFFDTTLPHELGHIIFREFVGFEVDIPIWFEEGVAMNQEKAKRWGSGKIVLQAIEQDRFIPLGELSHVQLPSDADPALVDIVYAESASVVYYIITEFGKQKFVNFCRKLKEKRSFEAAMKTAYFRFEDINHLNKSWINYLHGR